MKFDLSAIPVEQIDQSVKVGDVFPARGGRGGTVAWVVVSVGDNVAHLLGCNVAGEIVSTSSYNLHALENRPMLGTCPDVKGFVATIQRQHRI
jgi:hypothetical protein